MGYYSSDSSYSDSVCPTGGALRTSFRWGRSILQRSEAEEEDEHCPTLVRTSPRRTQAQKAGNGAKVVDFLHGAGTGEPSTSAADRRSTAKPGPAVSRPASATDCATTTGRVPYTQLQSSRYIQPQLGKLF